jgi:hypothetical protein
MCRYYRFYLISFRIRNGILTRWKNLLPWWYEIIALGWTQKMIYKAMFSELRKRFTKPCFLNSEKDLQSYVFWTQKMIYKAMFSELRKWFSKSCFPPRLMGDRLPRRMTDLQAMTGGRGRSSTAAAATEDNKPEEQVSLLEAAVSRLTAAETPTPDGAAAPSSSTSSRLSMLILPRVERLEESVRSVKKDLGKGESGLHSIYRNPESYCKLCCGSMTFWIGSGSADPCKWLGSGSGSCYFHHWPWDANKKLIYLKKFFCILLFEGSFTSFFNDKKSKRSHKTVEIKVFLTIFGLC